ncbi:MAG: EAL domain-containing protein [Methylotenera sp.]
MIKFITLVVILVASFNAYGFKQNFNESAAESSSITLDLTSEEQDWLAQHPVIRVGVKHSWKPIEFVTEHRKFRGITMDYLNRLEPILGVQFEKVNIDENPSHIVDMLSAVSNTKKLDQTNFSLTKPILSARYAVYQHKNNQANFDFLDLSNKRIAVFKYGELVEYLSSNYPNASLFKINVIEEAFNDIELNNSTFYIGNEMVVDYEANLQGISYLKKVGYAPIETDLKMAVRKDWPIMLSILNKSFAALEAEKSEILDHWNMSLFKKNKIAIRVLLVIFALFVISLFFKGYKLKLAMKKQEESAQNLIWHQAHFDAQTDLPNRVFFEKLKKQSFESALSNHLKLGFIYIDLDGFKQVNDIHGHLMGDELIIQVANRLRSCIRPIDNVARLAGDEFAIILNDLSEVAIIDSVAKRILDSLSMPYLIQHTKINITASIGSSIFPNDTDNIETLIKYADTAMYEAKLLGKNNHKAFNQSMYDKIIKKQSILIDLKKAIPANELRLYYQPIVNLETRKIVKAEALIRWQHPNKGLIGPGEFISIAESANIISEIGDWVFKQAVMDIKKLQKNISSSFSVSINVSPKQLQSSVLIAQWPSYLHKQHLNKNSLGLEITEGIAIETSSAINHILQQLKEAGAQLLIDDFGTGYSSLSYLKKLNADYIKIDKSFVQNLSLYSEDMVLCETIILMAHKLGLEVIAEGIETQEQSNLLQSIGCDYGQGYLFSKPKPLDQLLADYATQSRNHHKETQTTGIEI